MPSLPASDLLILGPPELLGQADAFTGVSTDTRSLASGELFIALRGEKLDGHEYIEAALAKGATGFVVDRKGFSKHRASFREEWVFVVEDTTRAYGELARQHRRRFDIPVIAIAGSNGKTGTKDLVAHVLAAKGAVHATPGNLNNHVGVPRTLLGLEKKHRFAVIEIGTNHPGEIRTLCEILEPTIGLITNIGYEHMEFFGDLAGVAKGECELFDWLEAHEGTALVNLDDPFLAKWAAGHAKAMKKRLEGYGFETKASLRGKDLGMDAAFRPRLGVQGPGLRLETTVGGFGKGSLFAALAACAVANRLKMPAAAVKSRLASFVPPPNKRMQLVRHGEILFINDAYNSNPDSVRLGLANLAAYPAKGRKIAVLGDMLELGEKAPAHHKDAGVLAKKHGFHAVLAFGPLSRATAEAAGKTARHFRNKVALVAELRTIAAPGDVIYVKGSRGMKMEEVIDAFLAPVAKVEAKKSSLPRKAPLPPNGRKEKAAPAKKKSPKKAKPTAEKPKKSPKTAAKSTKKKR